MLDERSLSLSNSGTDNAGPFADLLLLLLDRGCAGLLTG